MRTMITFTLLTLALLLASSAPAQAQYHAGSVGVGMESPLSLANTTPLSRVTGRLPGLSLRLQLSETFGLQAIVAYRVGTAKNTGVDNTRTSLIGTFLRAHVAAIRHDIVALGVFGGFGFVNAKFNPPGPGDAVTRFITFEGGLRPELWIADRASIHMQVGLTFAFATGDDTDFANEGFGFSIGHNAGLLGGAGITVWFGGGDPSPPPASSEPSEPAGGYGAPAPTPPPAAGAEPASDPNAPPPDWESGDPGW